MKKKKGFLNKLLIAQSPVLGMTVSVAKNVAKSVSSATKKKTNATKVAKSILDGSVNGVKEYVSDTRDLVAETTTTVLSTVGKIVHKTVRVLLTNSLIRKIVQAITVLLRKDRNSGVQSSTTFKYKIAEAKKNAVDVGIFNGNSQQVTKVEIVSTQGVADDVQYNQWQYV